MGGNGTQCTMWTGRGKIILVIVPCLDLFVVMETNYDFHNYYYEKNCEVVLPKIYMWLFLKFILSSLA